MSWTRWSQSTPADLPVIGRSLYRSLLRAVSYLPCEYSRVYWRGFLANRTRYHGARLAKFKTVEVLEEKQKVFAQVLRRGRLVLHKLQRAGDGHLLDLQRVVECTFGRHGDRRVRLLAELRSQEEGQPATSRFIKHLALRPNLSQEMFSKLPCPGPQWSALIAGQRSHTPSGTHVRQIGSSLMKPASVDVNIWGRPMPVKRVNNDVKKWFNQLKIASLPPLPDAEFEVLQELATGVKTWSRTGRSPRPITKTTPTDPSSYLTNHQDMNAALQVFKVSKQMPHHITPRFMRAIYRHVFAQCPKLLLVSAEKNIWRTEWGTQILLSKRKAKQSVVGEMVAGLQRRLELLDI